jgi:dTDP-4-amino-4,6-dideoxygalactose transaminase
MNISIDGIRKAITQKQKRLYRFTCLDVQPIWGAIMAIAKEHNLYVIEDTHKLLS